MKRAALILATILLASSAGRAWAVEHHVVQWKKTSQCEIVTRLPFFGNHWVTRATFFNRFAAERELDRLRRQRECPPVPRPSG